MIIGFEDALFIAVITYIVFYIISAYTKMMREGMYNKYKSGGGSELSVPIPAQWIGEWW